MRKNCKQAFESWQNETQSFPADSIWTDGETLYSYGTAIVTWSDLATEVYFNATKYSATTTTHQNAIYQELQRMNVGIHIVENIPRGSGAYSLVTAEKTMVLDR